MEGGSSSIDSHIYFALHYIHQIPFLSIHKYYKYSHITRDRYSSQTEYDVFIKYRGDVCTCECKELQRWGYARWKNKQMEEKMLYASVSTMRKSIDKLIARSWMLVSSEWRSMWRVVTQSMSAWWPTSNDHDEKQKSEVESEQITPSEQSFYSAMYALLVSNWEPRRTPHRLPSVCYQPFSALATRSSSVNPWLFGLQGFANDFGFVPILHVVVSRQDST